MRFLPKILLGIALALLVVLLVQIKNPQKSSQIRIEAFQDHFKVAFDITKTDQQKAQKTLEILNLPQHLLTGFEFELDSTSSAKLAFASPITINLDFENTKVNFAGQMTVTSPINLTANSNLKIPKNAKIGIFTQDFKKFAQKILQDPKLIEWYNQNFAPNAQYLIIFGQKEFIVVASRTDPVSFSDLESLDTGLDQAYKVESFDLAGVKTVDLHILKSQSTFFQLAENLYFANSPQTAKDFINAQIGNAPAITFTNSNLGDVSFVAFWQQQESSSAQDLDLILGTGHNIEKYLTNIERFELIQKNDKFESTIRFKSSN